MAFFGRAYPLRAAIKILTPPLGGAEQDLATSLVTDTDVFYAPTVAPGAVTLTPSLYSDTDTFYAPTVTPAYTLTPSLFTDTDVFYAPTVSATITLLPGLFTDTDTFYVPAVTPGAITLTPSLFSDTDTFYAPSISYSYTLTPGLFTDADSFYAPTVIPGAVTLSPSLYVDTDTIYAASVSAGDVTLLPLLYSDTDTFYASTVVPGAITLSPSLFTDTDSFHLPTVTARNTLAPSLFSDTDAFYSPSLLDTVTLRPSLFTDSDVLPLPTLTDIDTLLPGLVNSADVFYSPTVKGQILTASLYVDTESFYAPSIHGTPVTVSPGRYIDTDLFYVPAVQRSTVHGGNGGGGGGGNVTSDLKYATKFVMDASGLIVALQMTTTIAKTVNTRMMLYADNAGVPGALLAQSAVKGSIIIGTQTYPLLTPVAVLVGTPVWITVQTDGKISWLVTASTGGSRYNTDLFSDGPSDPFGPSSVDNKKAPLLLVLLNSVNSNVSPTLYVDSETFYSPVISTSNTMLPNRYVDTDFFYPPAVAGVSPIQLIYLNEVESSDEFIITPLVSTTITLFPSFVTTDDATIIPVVGVGDGNVFPPQTGVDDVIYSATVTPLGADLLPGLVVSDDSIPTATVSSSIESDIDFVDSDDQIRSPTVTAGAVILAPSRITDQDQFWLEELLRGPGITDVDPISVVSDDLFYSPSLGVPGHNHKATILGRADKVMGTIKGSATGATTLSGDASKVVGALKGSATGNSVTIKGDASKVKATLEGSDA